MLLMSQELTTFTSFNHLRNKEVGQDIKWSAGLDDLLIFRTLGASAVDKRLLPGLFPFVLAGSLQDLGDG